MLLHLLTSAWQGVNIFVESELQTIIALSHTYVTSITYLIYVTSIT